MGDPRAFLNIPRQEAGYRPVNERIIEYKQPQVTGFSLYGLRRTLLPLGMPDRE